MLLKLTIRVLNEGYDNHKYSKTINGEHNQISKLIGGCHANESTSLH